METLVLTDPVITPSKVTNTYHVVSILLDIETQSRTGGGPGMIAIRLRNNNGEISSYSYNGQQAIDMIKVLNTANLSVKSMHKRVLERLSADGFLPGTVQGAPDA